MINEFKESLSKEFLDNFNKYKISSSEYSNSKEKFDLLNRIGIIKNFDDFLKGKDIIFYDDKIKILKDIIFNLENIKYNTGLQLFNGIINSFYLLKDKLTFEVIIDELKLNINDFIFDNEILIYSLCIEGANIKNTAKLLNLLVKYLKIFNKKTDLIDYINLSGNFGYSNENTNLIKAFKKASKSYLDEEKVFYEGDKIGNIFYLENFSNISSIIKYNFKTNLLTYKNNKSISFTSTKIQLEFIETLYKNMNSWVCEDDLPGNSEQTLKDIKIKMKKGKINPFTDLELKMIFQSFTDNNKSYFIMIG